MTITGKIQRILPLQTGVSAQGKEWRRLTVIIETDPDGKYPRTVAVTLMGARIDECSQHLAPGNAVTMDVDVSSREFNGRWYTDVSAWRVSPATASAATAAAPAAVHPGIAQAQAMYAAAPPAPATPAAPAPDPLGDPLPF